MTCSCIAVKKPFRRTDPCLSAICSTLPCLHIVGWGHTGVSCVRLFGTIVFWLCYYSLSSVASSFAFAHSNSSGMYLSSTFTTAAWGGNVASLFKKYVWRSFTCLSCSWVTSVNSLPSIYCGRVSPSFAAQGWWNLYLVSKVLVLVWRFCRSVGIHFTIPKLKVSTGVA